jgi:hypothetical protein
VITVVVVNHGDYLGRGRMYVDKMRNMVARHLSPPYEFVCLEDVGPHAGWWAKIELFRPGRFTGRVFYTDLDAVITGSLDRLVSHKGILHLTDWGWKTPTYGSGVMVWDAGEHTEIFERFDLSVPERFRGDQDWLTHLGGWPALPAHLCRSYRYHCKKAVPMGCSHVSMHGEPKPHEIKTGWVPQEWR